MRTECAEHAPSMQVPEPRDPDAGIHVVGQEDCALEQELL